MGLGNFSTGLTRFHATWASIGATARFVKEICNIFQDGQGSSGPTRLKCWQLWVSANLGVGFVLDGQLLHVCPGSGGPRQKGRTAVWFPPPLRAILLYGTASFGTLAWDRLLGLTATSTSWQMSVTSAWLQFFINIYCQFDLTCQHRPGVKTEGDWVLLLLFKAGIISPLRGKSFTLTFFTSIYHREP